MSAVRRAKKTMGSNARRGPGAALFLNAVAFPPAAHLDSFGHECVAGRQQSSLEE